MNFRFALYIIVFSSITSVSAQSPTISQEELTVDVNQNNEILLIHTILAKETLYSIARYYRIPLAKLMSVNGISDGQTISVNSQLRIPILNNHIIKATHRIEQDWIPVIYLVKKKETLYTIAKKYFPQQIDALNDRNHISSFIIDEGQKIVVGWWSPNYYEQSMEAATMTAILTDSKKESLVESSVGINNKERAVLTEDNETISTVREKALQLAQAQKKAPISNRKNFNEMKALNLPRMERIISLHDRYEPVMISDDKRAIISTDTVAIDTRVSTSIKGLCLWMKNDPETKELLAFHRTAKIGSTMELFYPLTQRSVTVEIIDNIKSDLYADDIDIIVTKAVALSLGARDSRIQIKMDYYE